MHNNGTILSFVPEKGFGFIKPAGGGENFFFHINDLDSIDQEEICTGLQVVFLADRNDKGLAARKVRKDPN